MKNIYQDTSRSVAERVDDLVSRMTLNQKIRQLSCLMVVGEPKLELFEDGIGEVIFFSTDTDPAKFAEGNHKIQEMVINSNSLNIPTIIHAEALSGLVSPGCAIFPTSINLGATFDTDIVSDMAGRIKEQMLNLGVRQALSPVLDLIRDFRWGRTGEDYSSDPTLVSAMACAYIKALQGDDEIIATAKHFLGYSTPEGGLNSSRIHTDRLDMRENFAKPFEAAIRKAGLKSIMNSYGEFAGEPICSSKKILTDLLRNDLGFDGIVVSDYMSANGLIDALKTAGSPEEAGMQCISAGLDIELPSVFAYGPELREAVKRGDIDEEVINLSVKRMLTQKFSIGLFDGKISQYLPIDNTENDIASLKAAEKSIVLLKNDGVLPLARDKKIAIVGPTADGIRILNNGYTWPAALEMSMCMMEQERGTMAGIDDVFNSVTEGMAGQGKLLDKSAEVDYMLRLEHPTAKSILDGIKEVYTNVAFAKGCSITGEDESGFEEALAIAKTADVVILTLGGKVGWGNSCSCGEGIDNIEIGLPGVQAKLCREVLAIGKKTVLVHTDVKPLVDEFAYKNCDAIVEAWMPGPFGGEAIAKVLAGEINPGGRLPVDIPRDIGQTPVYYYQRNYSRSDRPTRSLAEKNYRTCPTSAQLPFGFGLSYTTFSYAKPEWKADKTKTTIFVSMSVEVSNTGKYHGDEVVQIYGMDDIASIVRPQKSLIGFKRISLAIGESKTVSFRFRLDQLAFPNQKGEWVLEKGLFTFELAKDANTPIDSFDYTLEATQTIDHTKRGFFAEVEMGYGR